MQSVGHVRFACAPVVVVTVVAVVTVVVAAVATSAPDSGGALERACALVPGAAPAPGPRRPVPIFFTAANHHHAWWW